MRRRPELPATVWSSRTSSPLRPGRGGDEVVAEADQAGLGLDRAGGEKDLLAPLRVGPLLAQRPARALDPIAGDAGEPGAFDLAGEPAGRVEVRRGEELRPAHRIGIAVLPVRQVTVHDRPEQRIIQPALI